MLSRWLCVRVCISAGGCENPWDIVHLIAFILGGEEGTRHLMFFIRLTSNATVPHGLGGVLEHTSPHVINQMGALSVDAQYPRSRL